MAVSVVVPVYNEEENVSILHERISAAMHSIKKPYEIIMVDDGSRDRTLEVLCDIQKDDPNLRVVKFRRNFGQSAAMAAGFDAARGDIVVAMDGDLQNDPGDIPLLLEKMDEGFDVVSGWRKNRKDNMLIRKVPSKIANRLICSVTGVDLHDTGCSLKAFRKEIIKRIRLYGELHRFIPALAKIEGARITEMAVNHHPRIYGQSKYNITRTFRVIMDLTSLNLFLKYFNNPLQFFGGLGLILMFIAGIIGMLTLGFAFTHDNAVSSMNILITLTFLLVILSFQFIFFGLLAALIVKTGNKKSAYLVETLTK
ncbi:glycosyltransferase family 2 protein [candidate division KSB1 bacterium]|nr:glycosyltransferase family 2 protein [candidate division KSB1 bacterium]